MHLSCLARCCLGLKLTEDNLLIIQHVGEKAEAELVTLRQGSKLVKTAPLPDSTKYGGIAVNVILLKTWSKKQALYHTLQWHMVTKLQS
ncbi:hypothetical protein P8452_40303 [Trifolium repens]|nr:hypothetical protein P8452_40303 [Trifolium repens]